MSPSGATRIDSLRHELGLPATAEFHFSECSHRLRVAFLQAVTPFDFWYYSFSLNKQNTYPGAFHDKESLHQHLLRFIFENLQDVIADAIVKMDKCGTDSFRSRLARHLKTRMNRIDGKVIIKSVKMADSSTNNLIQLADMVCAR